jgi:hypothetical protein
MIFNPWSWTQLVGSQEIIYSGIPDKCGYRFHPMQQSKKKPQFPKDRSTINWMLKSELRNHLKQYKNGKS